MKKIFALILALCLLCGTTALADDSNRQTELKTTIEESYTIVIPATLEIPFNSTSTNLPIEVTALRTYFSGPQKDTVRKLSVQVSSYGNPLMNETNNTISYTIGGSEDASGKYLYFTKPGTKNFTINIAQERWDDAPAGTYTNTIKFTVKIGDFAK